MINGGILHPSTGGGRPRARASPSAGRTLRLATLAVAASLLASALVVGCGGSDEPSAEFFSQSDEVIRQLIPEGAEFFNLRILPPGDGGAMRVDLTVKTFLEGEPRMHIVSDDGAIADARFLEEYEGFRLLEDDGVFWVELSVEPPLYAGTPGEAGIRPYVDFYRTGQPELAGERFWNAIDYAEGVIGEALSEAPSQLAVQYIDDLGPGAAGIRIEAAAGERRVYVGVLYASEGALAEGEAFDQETVEAFRQRFGVPAGAEERPPFPDWDYLHRIWHSDTGSADEA